MSRTFFLSFLLLCGVALSACGSDDESNTEQPKPPTESGCTVHCAP